MKNNCCIKIKILAIMFISLALSKNSYGNVYSFGETSTRVPAGEREYQCVAKQNDGSSIAILLDLFHEKTPQGKLIVVDKNGKREEADVRGDFSALDSSFARTHFFGGPDSQYVLTVLTTNGMISGSLFDVRGSSRLYGELAYFLFGKSGIGKFNCDFH